MCKWGTYKKVKVKIPANLSYTSKERWKFANIDSCIANIVSALQKGGINMRASCCGHNKRPSNIVLEDGREIFIVRDYDTARKTDKFFNTINFKSIGGE